MNTFEPLYEKIFPFWNTLCDSDKALLCSRSQNVSYKKGTKVHNGDECSGVIIVNSGCLRVYILSEEGRDVTLYRLQEGDLCMLSASCVLNAITFDVFIDAEVDSTCCLISGSAFAEVSERNADIKIFALETAVSRFSDVMWVMQQILFMSLDSRLAIFLTDELSRTGDSRITLTHEQIARYIGSAREAVSRMLKYFANEGIVSLSRNSIQVLDKQRLRKSALQHSENL